MTTEYACCLNCGCAEFVYNRIAKKITDAPWWRSKYEYSILTRCANCGNAKIDAKWLPLDNPEQDILTGKLIGKLE